MSSKRKNANKTWQTVFVYLRYILPPIFCVIALGTMFVTCLQYATVAGHNAPLSSAELFSNSWEQVRDYLFSGGKVEAKQETFAYVMLAWLIISAALWIVGAFSTVVTAVFAVRYMNYPDDKDGITLGFIAAVPNRIVVCVLQGLTLPVLFLSRIIIPMYGIMDVDVLLNVSAPEPWVWGLIFYGVSIVMSVISAVFEKNSGADLFKKRIVRESRMPKVRDTDEGEYTSMFSTETDTDDRTKEERAEMIRRLLNKDKDESN